MVTPVAERRGITRLKYLRNRVDESVIRKFRQATPCKKRSRPVSITLCIARIPPGSPAGWDVIIGHHTCQTGFPIFYPNHSLVGLEPTRTHPSGRPFIQASVGSKTRRHDLSPTLLWCLLRRSDKICEHPTLSLCRTGSLKSLCSSRASSAVAKP